jgi:hypothetical protein
MPLGGPYGRKLTVSEVKLRARPPSIAPPPLSVGTVHDSDGQIRRAATRGIGQPGSENRRIIMRFRYRPLTFACNASRMARISRIPRTVSGGGCLSNAVIAALASSGVKSRIQR